MSLPDTKTVFILVAFIAGLLLMLLLHDTLFAKSDSQSAELREKVTLLETQQTRSEILRARADLEGSVLKFAASEEAKQGVRQSLDLFFHRLSRVESGRPRPFAILGGEEEAGRVPKGGRK